MSQKYVEETDQAGMRSSASDAPPNMQISSQGDQNQENQRQLWSEIFSATCPTCVCDQPMHVDDQPFAVAQAQAGQSGYTAPNQTDWICDHCQETFTFPTMRYCHTQFCDFELCIPCGQIIYARQQGDDSNDIGMKIDTYRDLITGDCFKGNCSDMLKVTQLMAKNGLVTPAKTTQLTNIINSMDKYNYAAQYGQPARESCSGVELIASTVKSTTVKAKNKFGEASAHVFRRHQTQMACPGLLHLESREQYFDTIEKDVKVFDRLCRHTRISWSRIFLSIPWRGNAFPSGVHFDMSDPPDLKKLYKSLELELEMRTKVKLAMQNTGCEAAADAADIAKAKRKERANLAAKHGCELHDVEEKNPLEYFWVLRDVKF